MTVPADPTLPTATIPAATARSSSTPTQIIETRNTPETPAPPTAGPAAAVPVQTSPPVLTGPGISLELSSPADKPLAWSKSITVAGISSPGATVSVNGIPALPAADGRFSVTLSPGSPEGAELYPVLFEVVASTQAGGRAWAFTAALPNGDGVSTWIGMVEKVSADHPRAFSGETDVSLMTGGGLVELTATSETVVHIPGRDNQSRGSPAADELPIPLIQDVAVGDRAAISASNGRILILMVLPEAPINTLHLSGVVLASTASSSGVAFITLRDVHGNQISAPLPPTVQQPTLGSLVTAILARPSRGGELKITGLDPAASSLDRVSTALTLAEDTGSTEGVARLLRGLSVTATRNLTLLNQTSHSSQPPLAGLAMEEMTALQDAYQQTLARHESGPVLLEVRGMITSLGARSPQAREVTVESKSGTLELTLGRETGVWLTPAGTPPEALNGWLNGFAGVQDYTGEYGGSAISGDQLDLGRRVIAVYDSGTLEVARVAALASRRLDVDLARSLLLLAGKGEMVGKVTFLDLHGLARSVYIEDETAGGTVIFSAPPEIQPLIKGVPAPLANNIVGQTVSVLFKPGSGEIIEMSTLNLTPELEAVSGVVSSFVSKIFPGNVSIVTSQGELRTFTQDQATVIRRDGQRISVDDVRLGDLVRPNTLHHGRGSELGEGVPVLTYLSLKSPGPTHLTGTVRGFSHPSAGIPIGDTKVTLTTDTLDLFTLAVTPETGITRMGIEIPITSLRIGDGINRAIFDPIRQELILLELAAAAP